MKKQSILSVSIIAFCLLVSYTTKCFAQDVETPILATYAFGVDELDTEQLNQYVQPKIEESQFVLLGESHGVTEVGEITNYLYNRARPLGFNTLCIETDPLVAHIISDFSKDGNAIENAKKSENEFPWSIPFYNNYEDYVLLENIMKNNGNIWGLDQSMMAQFRLSFDYIIKNTTNAAIKQVAQEQLTIANDSYAAVSSTNDFRQAYVFKFDKVTQEKLKGTAKAQWEKDIVDDLIKTHEIYSYYFTGNHYQNNNVRAELMKSNFMDYMNGTNSRDTKALFKLGSNHVGKGITPTYVFDIGNMASELAASNGKRSLHIMANAVSGRVNRANPIQQDKVSEEINAEGNVPQALLELASASKKKFVVIKAEELRPHAMKLDKDTRDLIFKFDVIILINDAKPLTKF